MISRCHTRLCNVSLQSFKQEGEDAKEEERRKKSVDSITEKTKKMEVKDEDVVREEVQLSCCIQCRFNISLKFIFNFLLQASLWCQLYCIANGINYFAYLSNFCVYFIIIIIYS